MKWINDYVMDDDVIKINKIYLFLIFFACVTAYYVCDIFTFDILKRWEKPLTL